MSADEGGLTVPKMARRLRVSDQTLNRAVDAGLIPHKRNERGYRMVRREDIPDEWLRSVHRRRQARWGNGDEAEHEAEPVPVDEVEFLREQIRLQGETISRLMSLLEARSEVRR